MAENTRGPTGTGAGAGAGAAADGPLADGPLHVSARRQGGLLHVLSVRGEIDLSTAPALREAAESYVSGLAAAARGNQSGGGGGGGDNAPVLVVDLRRVGFIDSEGLVTLVNLLRRCAGVCGFALLAGRGTQPERVLKLGGYDRLLRVLHALDELPPGGGAPPPPP